MACLRGGGGGFDSWDEPADMRRVGDTRLPFPPPGWTEGFMSVKSIYEKNSLIGRRKKVFWYYIPLVFYKTWLYIMAREQNHPPPFNVMSVEIPLFWNFRRLSLFYRIQNIPCRSWLENLLDNKIFDIKIPNDWTQTTSLWVTLYFTTTFYITHNSSKKR